MVITRRGALLMGAAMAFTASARARNLYDPPRLPVGFSDTTGREVILNFNAAPCATNLVVLGQSNAANTNVLVDFVPANGVTNINPYDGKVYKAREPLLGASYGNPPFVGGFSPRLGEILLEQ